MPKYCRAPNCSNTAGRLGADNLPVSFYRWWCPPLSITPESALLTKRERASEPAADEGIQLYFWSTSVHGIDTGLPFSVVGHEIRDWLRHMGHEDWVPSCHQHLCSEHFPPSCVQWSWGVRYLWADAVLSIFSLAPPAKRQQSSRSTEKAGVPPSPPEAAPLSPGPAVGPWAPVHIVVLGSASGGPEATTAVFLTPPCPLLLPGPQPGVQAQQPLARLGTVLGALQRRVRRLQGRQEQPQGQLWAIEQLGQQVCKEGLPPRGTGACCAWRQTEYLSLHGPHIFLCPHTSLFPARMSLWPHISSRLPTNLSAHISVFPGIPPPHLGLPVHHFSRRPLCPFSCPPLFPLCSPSLSLLCLGLPGSLDRRNPIICGGPDIAVVIAQSPAPPTLDAKPELLDTETPSA
uniref:LOW QUALITY PROTEIN: THAP domain-containing protein 8 n=1 Tax=Callorhinus ursinus TaxID=34884 RepID=A0A3Q7MSM9_CALUR|nr:LOW QUALITY PROTEIN: THAP domain-containing protein 8 [Callorhinus ursinus]